MDPAIFIQLAINGLLRGSMYGLMGMGLALIFGIMGIVNFAHGELFMLGAYLMYWVVVLLKLPLWLGLTVSVIILLPFGMMLELGLISPLRARLGERWLIDGYVLTIGLSIMMQNLALILFGGAQYGVAILIPGQYNIGGVVITREKLVIFLVALIAALGLAGVMRFTHLGRAIRATSDNPAAAQALGIDIRRIYRIAFGISAALAGGAGALLLPIFPAYPTVGGEILLRAFVVVIIGGLGNMWVAMVAGPLLGIVEAFASAFASGGWQSTITAIIVLGVLLLRPRGLFSKQVTRP
jgi:branched-chain amino acid transport system permease protein